MATTKIKDYFKGKTPDEARELLETNADRRSKELIETPLSEAEMEEIRLDLADASAKKYAIDAEKKRITQKLNEQLKPVAKVIIISSHLLHHKTKVVETEVFGIADYDQRLMHSYDSTGKYLSSRPLTAEERQLSVSFNSSKAK